MRLSRVSPMIALSISILHAVRAGEAWEICEQYTPVPGRHHAAFELGCWGNDGSHLHALFMYAWRRYPDDPPPAMLHGARDGNFFRPNVTFQIGRCWKGPWKTIRRLHVGDEPLSIDKSKGGSGLEVQLDAFRPYLRSGKCGRVILESGEGDAFSLDSLLPEKERTKHHEQT
ncbi:MAG: hypothetical protein WA269_06405 [Candidatus Udaeobacter sp.]